MTRYFVDPISGDNADNGTTAALAKLTMAGAFALSLSAGDIITVRGGAFVREDITCTVSGSSGAGNSITIEGDVEGLYWPGSVGLPIWTGSDDDEVTTRSGCLDADGESYYVLRGIHFCHTSSYPVVMTTGWVMEDCAVTTDNRGPYLDGDATIRRCTLSCPDGSYGIWLTGGGGNLIEECEFTKVGRIALYGDDNRVRNCTALGDLQVRQMDTPTTLPGRAEGLISGNEMTLRALSTSDLIDDGGCLCINDMNDTNVTLDASSGGNECFVLRAPHHNAHGVPEYRGRLEVLTGNPTGLGSADSAGPDYSGVPRDLGATPDAGAFQRVPFTRDATDRIEIPPNTSYWPPIEIPVTASTAVTVQAHVDTDSTAISDEPELVLLADYGEAEDVSPSTDVENTPETLTVTATPDADGIMYAYIRNSGNATVFVTLFKVQ